MAGFSSGTQVNLDSKNQCHATILQIATRFNDALNARDADNANWGLKTGCGGGKMLISGIPFFM
jgi:hypothetical protein